MKLFQRRKKEQPVVTIEELSASEYKQAYEEECRFIWKSYVSSSGQSDVLQGELLRELEKLRHEAQNNGNRNWDDDFAYFCDFIKSALCESDLFSDEKQQEIILIMNYLKECGDYAARWYRGEASERQLIVDKIAYVKDNLYDRIADAIGVLQLKFPDPIPYERNETIHR